jgi:hypothetical protein
LVIAESLAEGIVQYTVADAFPGTALTLGGADGTSVLDPTNEGVGRAAALTPGAMVIIDRTASTTTDRARRRDVGLGLILGLRVNAVTHPLLGRTAFLIRPGIEPDVPRDNERHVTLVTRPTLPAYRPCRQGVRQPRDDPRRAVTGQGSSVIAWDRPRCGKGSHIPGVDEANVVWLRFAGGSVPRVIPFSREPATSVRLKACA